jgi:hypothetical protein
LRSNFNEKVQNYFNKKWSILITKLTLL